MNKLFSDASYSAEPAARSARATLWDPARPGLQLFLRHLPPKTPSDRVVLYVHGATFPSALSIAHRFDGYAWRDALNEVGFHVWGFDFHGFGFSDRYPEMNAPADANPPLCNAADASAQLEAAVRFILAQHRVPQLSLITHSWASMPAGAFAGRCRSLVDRLVLFGPISRRPPRRYEKPPTAPAWRIVTLADQWARFVEDVPRDEPPVLSRAHFDDWGERYLDSDPESRCREPASVKIPTGPFLDILRAWHGESPMIRRRCRRRSRSSAANGTGSSRMAMRAGCSMPSRPRRSSATSRSAAAPISCIPRRCADGSSSGRGLQIW